MNMKLTNPLVSITLATLTTAANAQLVNVPVEVPMPPQVDPINFAISLSIGDDSFYVGGIGEIDNSPQTPSGVYEFDLDTLAYIRTLVGTADNPNTDFFGFSNEFANGVLWVGAPFTEEGDDNDGAAYAFDPATGTILNRFVVSSTFGNGGTFGFDLSITSSAILVGAPNYDTIGRAFIFNPITYDFFTALGPGPMTGDLRFGWRTQLSDQYLVISAIGDPGTSVPGAVYVYDFATGFLLYRLTSPITDIGGTGEFGYNIELEGDHLLISWGFNAPTDARGKVALYDLTSGSVVALLDGDTTTSQDGFGSSMSAEGNIAVIGAPSANEGGPDRGAIYLFNLSTSAMLEKITLPLSVNDRWSFGAPVKIQNGTILASSAVLGTIDQGRVNIIRQFCRPDLNLDGSIDFFDISIFVMEMIDWDLNGVFDFFDVSMFLQAFDEGCP